MEFQVTKKVIELLEIATTNASELCKINRPLLNKLSKELFQNGVNSSELCPIALDLLQAIQHLIRHCQGCFASLDEAGILELISAFLGKILQSLAKNGFESDVQVFIECFLESVQAIADSEPAAKPKVILGLFAGLLDLLGHSALVFKTRMEVLKAVNMLLEQCPIHTKEKVLDSKAVQQKVTALVDMVADIGDYEFQVGVIECLMRLFPRKARQNYASMFFRDAQMMEEFLMIRDKVFETDCRIFLNNVNSRNDDPTKGVFSFPCTSAVIGNKMLSKPDDPNYEEFWIDFNIGSMRITLFCEQSEIASQESQLEEGMWETLEICKSNVDKYSISTENNTVLLEINLKNSICQLYPSQHYSEQGDNITVEFVPDLADYISHAANQTFNFEKPKKMKVSMVELPLQISVKDQDFHEECTKKSREQIEHRMKTSTDSLTSSQGSVGKKKKVSVPTVALQLFSAPISIPSSRIETVKETSASKDTKTPKTPTKSTKGRVKVKTPVVEIGDPVKKDRKSNIANQNKKNKNTEHSTEIDTCNQEDIIIEESQEKINDVKQLASNNQNDNVDDIQNDSGLDADEIMPADDTSVNKIDNNEAKINMGKNDAQQKQTDNIYNSNNDLPEFDDDIQLGQETCKSSQDQDDQRSINSQDQIMQKYFTNFTKGKQLSQANFGFDDLDDIERVPETLDPKSSDKDKRQANGHTSEVQNECKRERKDLPDEATSDSKEPNISNKNKAAKKTKPEKKMNKVEKKKTFTDVDESLKEMCDLDDKDNHKRSHKMITKTTKALKDDPLNDKRTPLSQEEIESLYTFHDPEVDFDSVSRIDSKKASNEVDPVPQEQISERRDKTKKNKIRIIEQKKAVHNDKKTNKTKDTLKNVNYKPEKKTVSFKSKIEIGNASNETKTGRSLRSRRNKPNYKDVAETESIVYIDNAEEECVTNMNNDLDREKKISTAFSIQDTKQIEKKVFDNTFCNNVDSKKNTEINCSKVDSIESKMVTVNSDESDTDVHDCADVQEEQMHRAEIDESIKSIDKEFEESLYVESDDSCNARNYIMNYKEKKRRRSSIKKRDSLETLPGKSSLTKSKKYSKADKEIQEVDTESKRGKSKNVSFDDSVLKDISPIKRPSKDRVMKNTDNRGKSSQMKDNKPSMSIGKKGENKKNCPAQFSYSKIDSKWDKLQKSQTDKPGVGYDPFDFDEQIDNISNTSERIGRLDVSKKLNKKHGNKSNKEHMNTSKSKKKMSSEYEQIKAINISDDRTDDHDTSESLMMQDHVTKKWHRSNQNRHKGAADESNKENNKKKSKTNSIALQPEIANSEQTKHADTSEDFDLDIQSENTFENILKEIKYNRHDEKDDDKVTGYFGQYEDDGDLEQIVCISPIQTPYLSNASTPKVCNGKRKQYTPLSISIIKTPQSATSRDYEKKVSKDQSEEDLSSDNERVVDSLQNSEKSWIKSKMNGSKTKKRTPISYKHKKKPRSIPHYKDKSVSESDDSNNECSVVTPKKQNRCQKQTIDCIKPCLIHMQDIMLKRERNEETESQTAETSSTNTDEQDMSCNIKSQNLDNLILTPYTPMKTEHFEANTEFDIDTIPTQEDYPTTLSDQADDDDDDESDFNLYDSKYKKQTLLGDSGFHSGPSSAVRDSSLTLKRKYPDLNLVSLNDSYSGDELGQSDEEPENTPFIPKKLFKMDPSVKGRSSEADELRSLTDVTENILTSSYFGYNTCDDNNNTGFSSFVNTFGIDVKKQMERKREQVEVFTKQAVRELQKHHNQSWVVQQQYRSNVDVEFKTKMMLELEALERDIDLLKEAGQKTAEIYKYQLQVLSKNSTRQTTSLSNMKGLQAYLREKSRKVEKHNRNLQDDLKHVLKKDMVTLQKRLIEQTQKEELANVKRSLQRTFSTSMTW